MTRFPRRKGNGYVINVASAKNGVGYGPWTHIDGWSEAVVDYVRHLESRRAQNELSVGSSGAEFPYGFSDVFRRPRRQDAYHFPATRCSRKRMLSPGKFWLRSARPRSGIDHGSGEQSGNDRPYLRAASRTHSLLTGTVS